MRTDPEEKDFSEFLLDIGEGIINKKGSDKIKIPSEYLVKTQDDLIDHVFPNLDDIKDLTDGAIYTPLNKDMTDINQICLKRSLGDKRSYLSADTILEPDQEGVVPSEFLNSLSISGLPDHDLEIKEGAPVMLLRDLQGGPASSLRNGTRMIVKNMMDRVVECEVVVGESSGKRVFLPRIPHYDKSGDFPFTIVRRQFPIRLAFCITINKGCCTIKIHCTNTEYFLTIVP